MKRRRCREVGTEFRCAYNFLLIPCFFYDFCSTLTIGGAFLGEKGGVRGIIEQCRIGRGCF